MNTENSNIESVIADNENRMKSVGICKSVRVPVFLKCMYNKLDDTGIALKSYTLPLRNAIASLGSDRYIRFVTILEAELMASAPDKNQEEIDRAYEAALEEEWRMKTLENDLTPIVKRIIAKNYPEAFHMDSEGYKSLDDLVWKHLNKLVRDVNEFASKVKKGK